MCKLSNSEIGISIKKCIHVEEKQKSTVSANYILNGESDQRRKPTRKSKERNPPRERTKPMKVRGCDSIETRAKTRCSAISTSPFVCTLLRVRDRTVFYRFHTFLRLHLRKHVKLNSLYFSVCVCPLCMRARVSVHI